MPQIAHSQLIRASAAVGLPRSKASRELLAGSACGRPNDGARRYIPTFSARLNFLIGPSVVVEDCRMMIRCATSEPAVYPVDTASRSKEDCCGRIGRCRSAAETRAQYLLEPVAAWARGWQAIEPSLNRAAVLA